MEAVPTPLKGVNTPQAVAKGAMLAFTLWAAFVVYTGVYVWPVLQFLEAHFSFLRLLPIVIESTLAALLTAVVIAAPIAIAFRRRAQLATLIVVLPLLAMGVPALFEPAHRLTHLLEAYQLCMLILCPLAATQAASRRVANSRSCVLHLFHMPWAPLTTYVGLFACIHTATIVALAAAIYTLEVRPGPLGIAAITLADIALCGVATVMVFARQNRRTFTLSECRTLLFRSVQAAVVIQMILAIPKLGVEVLSFTFVAVSVVGAMAYLAVLAVVFSPRMGQLYVPSSPN